MPIGRRWLTRIAVGLVGTLASTYAVCWWQQRSARDELHAVIAVLDEREPGWRLDQIEANRRKVADAEQRRLVVKAALAAPSGEMGRRHRRRGRRDAAAMPPPRGDGRPAERSAQVDRVGRRRVPQDAELSDGSIRHRVRARTSCRPRIEEQANSRGVAHVLRMDACDASERKEPDRAISSLRALLNVGRSLGDEPLLISQLLRIAMANMTVQGLERTLAQGVAAEQEIAGMQAALTEETAVPYFFLGMRGERAGMHGSFLRIAEDSVPVTAAIQSALVCPAPPPQAGGTTSSTSGLAR